MQDPEVGAAGVISADRDHRWRLLASGPSYEERGVGITLGGGKVPPSPPAAGRQSPVTNEV